MNRIDQSDNSARGRAGGSLKRPGSGLLCVANFPANTGYAWNFIESLYAGIANRLAVHGIRTWAAYPSMPALPEPLRASEARAVELEVRLHSMASMRAVLDFVRSHHVRVVYLADRPAWHLSYAVLRMAGVRQIVVHDHTSGERTVPHGGKRWLKQMRHAARGALADQIIAVSDYVARRKVEVDLVPPERVRRIWNSVAIPDEDPSVRARLRALFRLKPSCPVIACACRAAPEKGVIHLMRAFDRLVARWTAASEPPALVYFGDGPALAQLRAAREALSARAAIFLAGHRSDAPALIAGANVCVAPSLWAEAFGLYALEPLARGVPVIASKVGGLPEVVIDGETGLLVPPRDEVALEKAMLRLIENPEEARRFGEAGRRRTALEFSRERQLDELLFILTNGDGGSLAEPGSFGLRRRAELPVDNVSRSGAVASEGSRR